MKFGLFLALLVLLASTNVFGQQGGRIQGKQNRPSRIQPNELATGQNIDDSTGLNSNNAMTGGQRENQPTKIIQIVQGKNKPVTVIREPTQPITIVEDQSKPVTILREPAKPITIVEGEGSPVTIIEGQQKPITIVEGTNKSVPVVNQQTTPITVVPEDGKSDVNVQPGTGKLNVNPVDHNETDINTKPDVEGIDDHQQQGTSPTEDEPEDETTSVDEVCMKTFSLLYIFFNFRLVNYLKRVYMLVVTLFSLNIVHPLLIQFNMMLMVHV